MVCGRKDRLLERMDFTYWNQGGGSRAEDSAREVDYITGCCMLVKREVIEKIGKLDAELLYLWRGFGLVYQSQKGWI